MPAWTVPQADVVYSPPIDPASLGGEDVVIVDGDHVLTPSGSLQTIVREAAARQSVVREALADAGSIPRLPNWGYGLPSLLFKGQTKATRGEVESRVRDGLRRNRRIRKTNSVETL